MTIQRCSAKTIDTHATRDAVSPSAANALKVAAFQSGARVQCRCAAGECSPDACDGLHVFDAQGSKLATFHGKGWRAVSDGNVLTIFRMPQSGSGTQDASKPLTLADLNRINREFYAHGGNL
jgi:hypothetical protein